MAWVDLIQMLGVGGGGSLIGLAVGSVTREAKFNARVDHELADLRKEVALCRAERIQFAIVKTGVVMALPELQRIDPFNPILAAVAAAFEQLPEEEDTIAALLRQLSETPDEQAD